MDGQVGDSLHETTPGYISLLSAFSTPAPWERFKVEPQHPVPKKSINPAIRGPIPTNKFYSNLFLGSQIQGVWLHPYQVWLTPPSGPSPNTGLNVSHVDPEQKGYGPDPNANPVQYYINPIGIRSFCFSAQELNPHTARVSLTPTESSIDVQILDEPGLRKITFPLVQGSGFITAIYTSVTPHFESGVGFREVVACTDPRPGVKKWRLFLEDGKTWLLYAHPVQGCVPPTLRRNNASSITAAHSFAGAFQLAKVPRDCGSFEALADMCTGTWPTGSHLTASLHDGAGSTYAFKYLTEDSGSAPSPLLMYALPHHVESFDPHTASCVKHEMVLWSTTKGPMKVVVAKQWGFLEDDLPRHISFSPFPNPNVVLGSEERNIILATAREEAMGDLLNESNLDSMYFSGKALDKYACLCWVIVELLDERHLGLELLVKVKEAFARFAENRQIYPLVYDAQWGGLVSSGMYKTGDLMQDFGNGCYNDHHFHFGYFIHAASIVVRLDLILGNGTNWLDHNREYVEFLIRDAAGVADPYFPFSRAFDWFHGHSWAKGLFESADGKDQESTSEDAYFSFSLKLWGIVTGDLALEGRGCLMLAIQRRVFRNYFLMDRDNRNQPENFIGNRVTGILFENKCDHATYFGMDPRFIQGIHMIPVSPISPYIRSASFIREEWRQYFEATTKDRAVALLKGLGGDRTGDDGWKGILWSNWAIVEPTEAWKFFSQREFPKTWLDGGATRTWYLALAAGWTRRGTI